MVLVLVKYLQGATFLQQMASKYHTLRPTRGESRGRDITRNSAWFLLLSFDMFCVGVASVSYLSYHVPMFDMSINSQQF